MKIYVITINLLFAFLGADAQVLLTNTTNRGDYMTNFSNAATIVNDPVSGFGYRSFNSGAFTHMGPATATLTVNGVYNANMTPAAPGIDSFQGLDGTKNTAVEITGTVAPTFGILVLDNGSNTASLTNSKGADVTNTAHFLNGITTTVRSKADTGALRFSDNATYTHTAIGDGQYVNGYVGKTGNDTFVFPVGNQSSSDLRILSISAPSADTTHLSVAYWSGNAGSALDPTGGAHPLSSINTTQLNGEVLMSVSPVGFWDWVPAKGNSNLAITVSLPAQSGLGSYTEAGSIRLVGFNTLTSQWELLGNTPASSLNEGATLSGATNAYGGNMSTYSAIGWGSINQTPLSQDLTSFTAQKQNAFSSILQWQVAANQDIHYFEAEHSYDGKNFTSMGRILFNGDNNYSFIDKTPWPNTNFYRLKVSGRNGAYFYSDIRKVSFGETDAIRMYPVPVISVLKLEGATAGMTLQISNIAGQITMTSTLNGRIPETIDFSGTPNGIYFVLIRDSKGAILYKKEIMKM